MVLADARSATLNASTPLALVLADARSLAFLALGPSALVLADARSSASFLSLIVLAERPLAFVVAL